jgi:hypothetical protein
MDQGILVGNQRKKRVLGKRAKGDSGEVLKVMMVKVIMLVV